MEAVYAIAQKDDTVRAAAIGEFPDMQCRFVTIHPFSENRVQFHKELDHLGSLFLDVCPPHMNMLVMELESEGDEDGLNGGAKENQ